MIWNSQVRRPRRESLLGNLEPRVFVQSLSAFSVQVHLYIPQFPGVMWNRNRGPLPCAEIAGKEVNLT